MSRAPRWMLAAASGLLLATAFPRLNLEPLAWVALVPLLVAVRGKRPWPAAGYGWITGFCFFLCVLYWIAPTVANFTRLGLPVAAGLCVLFAASAAYTFAAFAAVTEWLAAAGISRLLAAPVVWVVLEWLRTFVIAAFPWASLGYSQYKFLSVIQIADLTSVYGISALLVFFNVALVEIFAQPRRRVATAAAAVLVPALVLLYGNVRLSQLRSAPVTGALTAAFIQANIPQGQKWDPTRASSIIQRYLTLSTEAVERGARLIVWPESAVPFYVGPDVRTEILRDFTAKHGVHLLAGAPAYESRDGGPARPYNRAWLVTPERSLEGPYDKMQLVPFGEYIPLAGLFGAVDIVVEAVGEFGRGTEYVVFDGPSVESPGAAQGAGRPARFGTLICYEGIFPALTRRFVAGGADFLVNISNDAWYGATSAPVQHLSMVALRAVENRVPVLRSTNTGISAFIGADGSIGPTTYLFETDLGVEQMLFRDTDSFYRRAGDVFLYVCIVLLAALVALRIRRGTQTG